jgi:hypothetical protein
MPSRAASLTALVLLALGGCEGGGSDNTFAIYLVDPNGENPVTGLGPGELRVEVDQGEGFVPSVGEVRNGTFDIAVGIASHVEPTRVRAIFDLESGIRHGASPWFASLDSGFVNVIVGEPGTCATMVEPRTDVRIDAALVPFGIGVGMGVNHLVLGGTSSPGLESEGHDAIGSLVTIWLAHESAFTDENEFFGALSRSLRETHVAPLTATDSAARYLIAALAARDVVFVLDVGDEIAETDITAHAGAGASSTLVELGPDGAAIVGGAVDGAPVAQVTWVGDDIATTITALATARVRPAVVRLQDGGLLVAGGQAEGQPEIELVPFGGAGAAVTGAPTAVRDRPILVSDPSRRSALLLGGRDATGALRADSLIVDCTGACTVRPAASWARPRLDPAIARTGAATWLLGGTRADGTVSSDVDRVVIAGTEASIAEIPGGLPTPRARADAFELAGGVVVVAGGVEAADRPSRDVAICWPIALED